MRFLNFAFLLAAMGSLVAAAEPNPGQQSPPADSGPQILVHIEVLEVSLNKLEAAGVRLENSAAELIRTTAVADQPQDEKNSLYYLDGPQTERLITQLVRFGFAKRLAHPTVVSVSGRRVEFRSGQDIPLRRPKTEVPGVPDTIFSGTHWIVTPELRNNGRLRIDSDIRISAVDLTRSIEIGGRVVPGVRSFNVPIGVEIQPSQTLIYGGIQVDTLEAGDREPVRTERLFLLTAGLIEPSAENPQRR